MGVINELRVWDPLAQSHWRRCDQQDLASLQRDTGKEPLQPLGGLLRASSLEQVVGSQHDDQQIGVSWKGGRGGRNFPAVLPHVEDRPSGLRSQDVHPPAACVVAAAEIAPGIVAVGIGVAETDDVHLQLTLFPYVYVWYIVLSIFKVDFLFRLYYLYFFT